MSLKSAVFCHSGLGDGIISLTVSNNFHQNGWEVTTYHNGLSSLQSWFPHLEVKNYPSLSEKEKILETFDQIVLFHNDSNLFVLEMIEMGKKRYPEKVKVIYPYPSKGIYQRPYYKDSFLDPTKPLLTGLIQFCKESLSLEKITLENGFIAPLHLIHRKHKKRVALHVNSSREGKNWPIHKYVKLALHLKNNGFDPIFITGSKKDREAYLWLEEQGWEVPLFASLSELASYLYEVEFFVGNDSGLGHLASCLKIPTLTISRRKRVARFWKPSWTFSKLVCPYSWIPNLGGFRLRDRKWKAFISTRRVLKTFCKLVQEESLLG